MQQKPTKGQKKNKKKTNPNLTQADRVQNASEDEKTSKGRSYLAETETVRTVRTTKEFKTALHSIES